MRTARRTGSGSRRLEWLVVRDLVEIETAVVLVRRPGDRVGGADARRRSRPRSSSCRPRRTPRRTARSRTRSGCCSGTGRRSSRRTTAARSSGSTSTSAGGSSRSSRTRTEERDKLIKALTLGVSDALADRGAGRRGRAAGGQRLGDRERQVPLRLHGAEGRRLDALRLLDLLRLLRGRHQPDGAPEAALGAGRLRRARVGLGVAGEPADHLQPRLGRPRREAVVGAQALRLVGRRRGEVDRRRRPRLPGGQGARLRPARRCEGARTPSPATTRSSCRRTAAAGSSSRRASRTGRCRRTTSRTSRRSTTRSTRSARIRAASTPTTSREDPYNPVADEPGAEVYPYVVTTYRLTEHHTAGGMTRSVPYLAELQPEMFCEVQPGARARSVGLEHGGWATIYTSRVGDRGARARHRADATARG